MFEFGRDLRKLFEKARESDDLGWLELIGADLVEAEARREMTDAGRVSCTRPFTGWMRASALWREHARRTGRRTSLDRAASAASDAARHTTTVDQTAAAAIEAGAIPLPRLRPFGRPEGPGAGPEVREPEARRGSIDAGSLNQPRPRLRCRCSPRRTPPCDRSPVQARPGSGAARRRSRRCRCRGCSAGWPCRRGSG